MRRILYRSAGPAFAGAVWGTGGCGRYLYSPFYAVFRNSIAQKLRFRFALAGRIDNRGQFGIRPNPKQYLAFCAFVRHDGNPLTPPQKKCKKTIDGVLN